MCYPGRAVGAFVPSGARKRRSSRAAPVAQERNPTAGNAVQPCRACRAGVATLSPETPSSRASTVARPYRRRLSRKICLAEDSETLAGQD